MLKTKKVIGILAWMVFLIIPIPMNYLYAYIYRVAARVYGLFFIWIYVYAFIIYVGIGIILGAIGFSRERKFSGCWHISPIYLISGLLALALTVLLNTPLSFYFFQELLDPFCFWATGAGFLIISAWRKQSEQLFSIIFSVTLLLFPIILGVAKPLIGKIMIDTTVFYRVLYFVYGGILGISLFYRERRSRGKWRADPCKLIIGGIALLLTCCFPVTVYISGIAVTEVFYIWPITAGFMLIGMWTKLPISSRHMGDFNRKQEKYLLDK